MTAALVSAVREDLRRTPRALTLSMAVFFLVLISDVGDL